MPCNRKFSGHYTSAAFEKLNIMSGIESEAESGNIYHFSGEK